MRENTEFLQIRQFRDERSQQLFMSLDKSPPGVRTIYDAIGFMHRITLGDPNPISGHENLFAEHAPYTMWSPVFHPRGKAFQTIKTLHIHPVCEIFLSVHDTTASMLINVYSNIRAARGHHTDERVLLIILKAELETGKALSFELR